MHPMFNPRFLTLAGMILIAALSRLLPHPWNFSPVGAMAIFAGAHFSRKWTAFIIPLAALLLSDIFLGFYPGMFFVYLSFCVNVLIGIAIRNRKNVAYIGGAALLGSIQFFILTNFGTWLAGFLYPVTAAGLVQCFTAAIPFFAHTVLGDAFYTALLFGSFAFAERRLPKLQEQTV